VTESTNLMTRNKLGRYRKCRGCGGMVQTVRTRRGYCGRCCVERGIPPKAQWNTMPARNQNKSSMSPEMSQAQAEAER